MSMHANPSGQQATAKAAPVHPALAAPERLSILRETALLDSESELAFDRLARLAAKLLDVPTVLVSLVDDERQFFKACVGLAEPYGSKRETPLSHSFCQYVVISQAPLIIDDARLHPELRDNLAIPDLHVVAYAGIPLTTNEGLTLGSLCAIDSKPRQWQPDDIRILTDLAASVVTEIELRLDIKRRESTEQTLRVSEERFRTIIETASDIIYDTDEYGRFLYVNPVAVQSTGFSREQLIGIRFTELVHPEEIVDVEAFYRQQFGAQLEHTYYEFRMVSATGRTMWIGQNVRLLQRYGKVVGAQAVARDITARREIERMKDEFISVVSHELRTPLTSMRGSLGLIASGKLPADKAQRMVDVAIESTDRLIRLTNDILDLGRINAGQLQLVRETHDLSELITEAVECLRPLGARASVQISARARSCSFSFDRDRMMQVIINVVSNAIKFSDKNAVVTINAGAQEGSCVIEVSNHGRGIPADKLEMIFEPFQQVDSSDARQKGGTGLGLPITKRIVEHHGGTISVASDPGRTTTFTIKLPMDIEHA